MGGIGLCTKLVGDLQMGCVWVINSLCLNVSASDSLVCILRGVYNGLSASATSVE